MTTAERLAALAAEFRPVLPGAPESVLLEVAGVASGLIAREAEKIARPYPWPPKPRPRLDEAKARQQERRTA